MSKKRKRRSVPKDKKTGVPKKYLSGLKGSKRMTRARLIKEEEEQQEIKNLTFKKNILKD